MPIAKGKFASRFHAENLHPYLELHPIQGVAYLRVWCGVARQAWFGRAGMVGTDTRASMEATNAAYMTLRDLWLRHGGKLTPRQARAITDAIAVLWKSVDAERNAQTELLNSMRQR